MNRNRAHCRAWLRALVLFAALILLADFVSFTALFRQEAAAAEPRGQYLPGGPLAALKLPPFPTHHGERPGRP